MNNKIGSKFEKAYLKPIFTKTKKGCQINDSLYNKVISIIFSGQKEAHDI
jgi:hypothetical protein